ncbi:MAG TPA: hypothetical protein VG273_24100 [Bryobacteraceae bacterium]|jgi:hypothetical protein|nr:hypothetical protein [Bryobacteraceae bacterium]
MTSVEIRELVRSIPVASMTDEQFRIVSKHFGFPSDIRKLTVAEFQMYCEARVEDLRRDAAEKGDEANRLEAELDAELAGGQSHE